MRRRRAEDLHALREEATGLVACIYYSAALGAAAGPDWCGVTALEDLARRLRLDPPPSLEELAENPSLVDAWAADCGLINRREVRGVRVQGR